MRTVVIHLLLSLNLVAMPAMRRRVGGKLWVLAVNERDAEVEAKLQLPGGAESFERWREDGNQPPVRGGDSIDSFGPYGVHVYREP
jgi:hypothetical protein